MEEAGLPALEYVETPSTVNLILHNTVNERLVYRNKALNEAINEANRDANEANGAFISQTKTPNRQSGGLAVRRQQIRPLANQ